MNLDLTNKFLLETRNKLAHSMFEMCVSEITRDNEGWLRVAILLANYVTPVQPWVTNNDILALVKQSVKNCVTVRARFLADRLDEIIKLTPDEEIFDKSIRELESELRKYLTDNGYAAD